MGNVLFRRLIDSIVLVWLTSVVVFTAVRVLPGDPALLMLGENATPQTVAALRSELGLDRSFPMQYAIFVTRALRGDLGISIRAQQPSLPFVLRRVPATFLLASCAVVLALLFGIPIGILSAVRRNSIYDAFARGLALLAQSTPNYWLGLLLITVFAVRLRWLPSSGYGEVRNIILPSITLAFVLIGLLVRVTRTEVLEVLGREYVRTAKAKGLRQARVFSRHVFRNALIPVLTVLGIQVGNLLGGAVITETVFAWPGLGYLTVQGVYQRDYPIVQTAVLLSAVVFVVVNSIVDVLYIVLDPRIRYA